MQYPINRIDYFDSVGNLMQGIWKLIADGVHNISKFPDLLHNAMDWTEQGLSVLPDMMLPIVFFAVGGVLLFRFIRM